jgi:hypothetical protein
MTKEVDDLLRENLKLNGHSHNRKFFRELMGVKKSRGNELYNKWFRTVEPEGIPATVEIKTNEKYSYNTENDTYIVNIKCLAKPFVINGSTHRAICRAYSDLGSSVSSEEICRKYGISPEVFSSYKGIFKLTKNSLPLSDEVIEQNSVADSAADMIEQKKFQIYQEFEKESWKETQAAAQKWRHLEARTLDPIRQFLLNWNPPKYEPYEPKIVDTKEGFTFINVLSDVHAGLYSNEKTLFRGEGHSTEKTVAAIKSYSEKIVDDISRFNIPLDHIITVMSGDIINSCNPYGQTTKGTQLRNDKLDEELFEIIFNSMVDFISTTSRMANSMTLYSTGGNHAGILDNILAFALSIYFKDQKNIKFVINTSFAGVFVERNTLFVYSHGAHNSYKAKAPKGLKLENYIQSLIIAKQNEFKNVKSRVCLMADLHNFSMKEHNDFYYILTPSIIGGKDHYADALNLNSHPAQVALLLDDHGIKSIFNYYL